MGWPPQSHTVSGALSVYVFMTVCVSDMSEHVVFFLLFFFIHLLRFMHRNAGIMLSANDMSPTSAKEVLLSFLYRTI